MEFQTRRFGMIDVDESRVITMRGGILGFEHLLTYTLLIPDRDNPLWWLQSLEEDTLAFVVINPQVIRMDYHPGIPKAALAFLGISHEETMSLLSIVTIRSEPFCVTANLRAPLVINVEKRVGGQVVLEDDQYQVRYEVPSSAEAEVRTGAVKIAGA